MAKRRYLDVLLGLFVAFGVLLLITFIFLIGRERRLFDTSAHVRCQFPNVAGLAVGAEVLLGGVIIGHVSEIKFPSLAPTKGAKHPREVTVVLRVSKSMLPWIREDSLARVDSKGLLGDKNINVTLGTPEEPPIKDGGWVKSVPPVDINEELAKAGDVLNDVAAGVAAARKLIEGFIKEGGDTALAKAAGHLRDISAEVENGGGLVHQLIYDRKVSKDVKQGVADLGEAIAHTRDATKRIDAILNQVENGESLVHSLMYDPKGALTIASVQDDLHELGQILKDLQANGTSKSIFSNLKEASSDLQTILARIKRGEGTVGRLLIDPTVYEDIKQILGQVKRNEVLKALIRYGISKKENEAVVKPAK